jgi:FAD/FMN-containing dehydrogenase
VGWSWRNPFSGSADARHDNAATGPGDREFTVVICGGFYDPGMSSVSRRNFLALAGAAGLSACAPKPSHSVASAAPAPVTTTAAPSPGSAPQALDLAKLRAALTGRLVLPGDAAYAVAAQPYNAALGTRQPAAIAQVASAKDVATCVTLAGGRGVPLAARSGGHSYAGWSTPDHGVVVDVGALNKIQVSGTTATVGSGARLIDVYAALAAAGRALPAGSCPTVGIAGSTLGGGIGVLSRAYGLTCDHVTSVRVVTADGELHNAGPNTDADLFWALRGGGGGNAGIVTEFTFSTVPAPAVTVFSLHFPAVRTARVLRAWSQWMAVAPNQLTALCGVTAAKVPTNRVTGTWTGPAAQLTPHLTALISAVGAAPDTRFTKTYGYLDAMKYFAGCSSKTVPACHPASVPGGTLGREAFRAASRILDRPADDPTAERIVALMAQRSGMVLLFDSLRGAVAAPSATETAFPHRAAFASVQIYSGSASANPAVIAVQDALAPLVGRGAYVNYLNQDQSGWAQSYYGGNLDRLRTVVRHYDPRGIFAFPQSVLRA